MTIARSVADVLRNHVVLEYEAIDRMYLNGYVPHLQTVGATVGYLRVHHGQRFASTTAVAPMTEAFVRNVEQFVAAEGIDLITFEKKQRKDEVTQKYLQDFQKSEGVLYVGKAQEKARVNFPLLKLEFILQWRKGQVRRTVRSSRKAGERCYAAFPLKGFGSVVRCPS
jgi:hypothetical protein